MSDTVIETAVVETPSQAEVETPAEHAEHEILEATQSQEIGQLQGCVREQGERIASLEARLNAMAQDIDEVEEQVEEAEETAEAAAVIATVAVEEAVQAEEAAEEAEEIAEVVAEIDSEPVTEIETEEPVSEELAEEQTTPKRRKRLAYGKRRR